jgi:hypothetical protein
VANLFISLEFSKYINNRDSVIDVLSARVEKDCAKVLCVKVLETLGHALMNLIVKLGNVVGTTVWILIIRQSEFSLKEQVISKGDRGFSKCHSYEVFSVIPWLVSGIHCLKSGLEGKSDKRNCLLFLPGCSIENRGYGCARFGS